MNDLQLSEVCSYISDHQAWGRYLDLYELLKMYSLCKYLICIVDVHYHYPYHVFLQYFVLLHILHICITLLHCWHNYLCINHSHYLLKHSRNEHHSSFTIFCTAELLQCFCIHLFIFALHCYYPINCIRHVYIEL